MHDRHEPDLFVPLQTVREHSRLLPWVWSAASLAIVLALTVAWRVSTTVGS